MKNYMTLIDIKFTEGELKAVPEQLLTSMLKLQETEGEIIPVYNHFQPEGDRVNISFTGGKFKVRNGINPTGSDACMPDGFSEIYYEPAQNEALGKHLAEYLEMVDDRNKRRALVEIVKGQYLILKHLYDDFDHDLIEATSIFIALYRQRAACVKLCDESDSYDAFDDGKWRFEEFCKLEDQWRENNTSIVDFFI